MGEMSPSSSPPSPSVAAAAAASALLLASLSLLLQVLGPLASRGLGSSAAAAPAAAVGLAVNLLFFLAELVAAAADGLVCGLNEKVSPSSVSSLKPAGAAACKSAHQNSTHDAVCTCRNT
jgi:hypothetical protein